MDRKQRFEGGILATLSIVLVSVFVLSVHMYDYLEQGTSDGALAVFADNVRNFIDNNEAVAVFLGTEETEAPEETDSVAIAEEAALYIERYNSIYESLK